jgi:hypothetical protein
LFATGARAVPVDVELALVVDVSNSIDASEFDLQQDGYAAAFQSAGVTDAIQALADAGTGGVAVSVFFFSTNAWQVIDWTVLDSAADSIAFGDAIGSLTAPNAGGADLTNIASGIEMARDSIITNIYEGARLIMDVSGDGEQNTELNERVDIFSCAVSGNCAAFAQTQRDMTETAGITINGLPIIDGFPDLVNYYETNVITSDGFALSATFDTFAATVEAKIFREIAPVPDPGPEPVVDPIPEPTTLVVFAFGLAGLGLMRRKRKI